MKHRFRSFSFWLAGGAALLAFVLPARAFAHDASSGGASTHSITDLFTITFWIAVPVFLLVEGLILFAILRYRRRRADEMPDQVEGNRPLEIGWTVLGFVIIGVLFAVTYRALRTEYTVKADNPDNEPDYTVHVSAYMWDWDYEYFVGDSQPTGVRTTTRLTIPADRAVYLEITSEDVQHSFWVPKLAGKVDAVPGHTNTMWLKVDQPGLYTGNCAEYCGAGHHNMLIEVEVLEPAAFGTWLKDQTAAASQFVPMGTDMQSEMPEGQADHGEQLFTQLGCSACHGAQDGVGPALSRIRQDAQHHEGYTAEQYLRESILMPCAYTTPGFSCQMMPSDFGEKLDAQMLADLIAYLKESD
jgi:cytochrome c oxidase subunit 2